MSLNRVTLIGNLGRDPEVRYTTGGTPVANLSVATTERIKEGSEWKDHTEWHKVVVWGGQAEMAGEMLRKGSRVYVEGPLRSSDWTDKDGVKRYKTEVKAARLIPLGQTQRAESKEEPGEPEELMDDDIPF